MFPLTTEDKRTNIKMEQERKIDVMIAEACHEEYVDIILDTIEAAAKVRGTGIAKRTHEYVAQKMKEGKAVIALEGNKFAGFSYIESWGNKQYVTTSGLIVHPDFRGLGIAKRIKEMTFQLAPRQDFQSDFGRRRHENEYGIRICTGYLC